MCVCVSGGLLEADELYMYWELEAGVKRDGRGVEGGGERERERERMTEKGREIDR